MHEERVILELKRDVAAQVSPGRLDHIRRVVIFSRALARRFGQDPRKAAIAAWAHDLVREWPGERLMAFARQHGYDMLPAERDKPILLHGPVAAILLERTYGYRDSGVDEAVRFHTLGNRRMGPLAKILFVADYAEPGRRYVQSAWRKGLKDMSLDAMVATVIRHSMERNKDAHPNTMELLRAVERGRWSWLRLLPTGKGRA